MKGFIFLIFAITLTLTSTVVVATEVDTPIISNTPMKLGYYQARRQAMRQRMRFHHDRIRARQSWRTPPWVIQKIELNRARVEAIQDVNDKYLDKISEMNPFY